MTNCRYQSQIVFKPHNLNLISSLIKFFSVLKKNNDDIFFHPHPLNEEYAHVLSEYNGEDCYVLMMLEDTLVGYGMLRGWDEGYKVPSLAIAIHPEYRGMGLSKRLIKYLHMQARLRGASKIRVKVYPHNIAAINLYQSLGYSFSHNEEGQHVKYVKLKPLVYISSSCVKNNTISNVIDFLFFNQIYNIELSGGTETYSGINDYIDKLNELEKASFLVHNYFPPPKDHFILNIASGDNSLRNKSIEFAKKSLSVAHKVNSPLYTLHAGYTKDLRLDKNYEQFIPCDNNLEYKLNSLETLEHSVRILCEEAKFYGLMFGVENLFPLPDNNFSLLCEEWEIDWLFRRCADLQNFGLLLDLGHAQISANLLEFDLDSFLESIVYKYRHKLLCLHLSENSSSRDDHILPEQDSWMINFIKRNELQYLPITLEARNSSLNEIVSYYHYLTEVLEK